MKRTILRYGLISAAILAGVNVLILLIFGVPEAEDYAMGEVIGYSIIVVSLIPVFLAIKYHRDHHEGIHLSFWRRFGIGLGVAAWPSFAFALYNFVYVTWIDPDFTQKYYQHSLDRARETMTSTEFQAYSAQVESQMAMFSDPWIQCAVMFFTVFLIGALIAFVSALLVRARTGEGSESRAAAT